MAAPSQFDSDTDSFHKDGKLRVENEHEKLFVFDSFSPPIAVLFDWDNTLVDTWKTIFYAMNKTLVAFGLDAWKEDFALSNIQHSGREAFPKLFRDKAKEAQKFFYKMIKEEHLQGLNPMPGAEALLQVLREKGIPLGIVSNKNGDLLRKEASHLGWKSYFDVLVGAGDAFRDKPAAEPILLALQTLKIPASAEVWMVGDAPVDWDCAKAAGCQAIAIGDRFEHSPSVFVSIENCCELKKIFAKM
jgi:phosphoglycolate phosphatase